VKSRREGSNLSNTGLQPDAYGKQKAKPF
jgi:hypothetical protein